jgi:hypothetical protein
MHISFTQLDVLLIIPLVTAVMGYRRILYRMLPGESKDKVYYGYSCVVWGQVILIRLFEGYSNLDLALDYLFFTYYLYKWWISGGGDGVKKILQSLAPKTPIVVQ